MLAKSLQRKRARAHSHTHARNSSKVIQIAVKLLESEISSKCQKVSNFNFSEIWVTLDQCAAR